MDRASGKTADRPQFKKLFEDAARRRFDLVLFWSLDRFTREGVLETLNHLQRLSACGVNWRSYQENYLDSCGPFRDVVISLMLRWPSKSGCAYRSGPRQAYNELGERGRYSEGHGWKWYMKKLRALQDGGMSLRKIAAKTKLSLSTVVKSLA